MATGPWDNVSLPSPPNGPAYLNAWAQLANTGSGLVNSAFNAYRQGQDFQYQQAQRNLFQNGIPPDAQGNPNYGAMFQQMIQSGGSPVAQQVLPSLIDLSLQQGNYNALRGLGGGNAPTVPALSNAAGPSNITGNFSSPSTTYQPPLSSTGGDLNPNAQNVQTLTASIASGRGIEDVPVSKMQSFAKALGVSLDQPLTGRQENLARKLIGANLGGGSVRGGTNAVPQSGNGDQQGDHERAAAGNEINPSMGEGSSAVSPRATSGQGRPPLRVTVHPDRGAVAGDGFEDRFRPTYYGGNGGQQVAQNTPLGDIRKAEELERRAREAYEVSGRPNMKPAQAEGARKIGDALHEQARQIRDTIQKYGSPEFNPALKGQISRFEGADKAVAEQIGSYVKSMPDARRMVQNLNVITDALRHAGNNLTVGPGAEAIVKMKQVLSNYAHEPVKGLSEAEVIQKFNIYLASENAHQLTPRPAWAEVQNFMRANPGLVNSKDGTLVLADVLRQGAQQTVELGQKGLDRRNWENWSAIEDRVFREHPVKLPFSGNQPGQPQGQTAPGRYQWTPNGGLQRVQ